MTSAFDLQGHRGARGLRPENTLPSFEAALDAGATSIETDLHLTRDAFVVLCHDPRLEYPPVAAPPAQRDAQRSGSCAGRPAIRSLDLADLRRCRADRNPDPARFPDQDPTITPLAGAFAQARGLEPYGIPTLDDLLHFVQAYAGEEGERAGKSGAQRRRAADLWFDLEIKRVPFSPETIGDGYDGRKPGLLEERVVTAIRAAGVVGRTRVRSFDHRAVALLRGLEPGITGAVLVDETAPLDPGELARRAGADLYCPSYRFVDEEVVHRAHAAGVRVLPWTVNEPDHWRRLLDWGVDGLTTDFPDRLAAFLRERGVAC
jgi:glycerophosphoryl diester phosphodiesterase